MDVASGVFATVSLGIQLFETVQKVRKVLKSIQNAPDEISTLVIKLDQLYLTIKEVNRLVEQQQQCAGFTFCDDLMEVALRSCFSSVKQLDLAIDGLQKKLATPKRLRRAWTSIATMLKKDEILKLQNSIVESMGYLTTALVLNSSNFALYQAQNLKIRSQALSQETCSLAFNEETTLTLNETAFGNAELERNPNNNQLTATETGSCLYKGFVGFIRHQNRAIFLKRKGQDASKKLSESKTIMINVPYLGLAIKYEYQNCFRIPKNLSFYHVIPHESRIFDCCVVGQIEEIQDLLKIDGISPFVQDEYGYTMLHYASLVNNAQLCTFLLGLGVDVNLNNVDGKKAITYVGWDTARSPASQSNTDNILRALTLAHDEISSEDLKQFAMGNRSIDTVRHMISILRSRDELLPEEIWRYGLGAALKTCGCILGDYSTSIPDSNPDLNNFRSLVKSLLQGSHGNLLERITRRQHQEPENFHECNECHPTLLDDLFYHSEDPFSSHESGQFWLSLLLEEGFDIDSYLREEESIHAARQYKIQPRCFPGDCWVPRKLCFQYGDFPMVTWEWWVDPEMPGSLACHEFKSMNNNHRYPRSDWDLEWPFDYPSWSDYSEPWWGGDEELDQWRKRNKLGKERFAQKAKKKLLKQARAHDGRPPASMPGSWPE